MNQTKTAPELILVICCLSCLTFFSFLLFFRLSLLTFVDLTHEWQRARVFFSIWFFLSHDVLIFHCTPLVLCLSLLHHLVLSVKCVIPFLPLCTSCVAFLHLLLYFLHHGFPRLTNKSTVNEPREEREGSATQHGKKSTSHSASASVSSRFRALSHVRQWRRRRRGSKIQHRQEFLVLHAFEHDAQGSNAAIQDTMHSAKSMQQRKPVHKSSLVHRMPRIKQSKHEIRKK